jgi:hypothetical protein
LLSIVEMARVRNGGKLFPNGSLNTYILIICGLNNRMSVLLRNTLLAFVWIVSVPSSIFLSRFVLHEGWVDCRNRKSIFRIWLLLELFMHESIVLQKLFRFQSRRMPMMCSMNGVEISITFSGCVRNLGI